MAKGSILSYCTFMNFNHKTTKIHHKYQQGIEDSWDAFEKGNKYHKRGYQKK